MLLIAEECRDYLVSQNLVQKPSANGTKPKCYIEPLTGAPSPEESGGTNITLRYSGGASSPSFGEFVDQIDIDFIIRATDLREALTLAFNISNAIDGLKAFNMDSLRVEQILRSRPFSRLVGPDQPASYTLIGQFRFMVRKSVQV